MSSPDTSAQAFRAVSFSPRSELVVIPNADEERPISYTKEDTSRFKRDLVTESRRMSRLIATTPPGMISQDVMDHLVGMESFLDLDMLRIIQTRKRRHVQGIVKLQSFCSEQELSILSMESSSWARDGASRRAGGLKTRSPVQG